MIKVSNVRASYPRIKGEWREIKRADGPNSWRAATPFGEHASSRSADETPRQDVSLGLHVFAVFFLSQLSTSSIRHL